MWSTGRFGWEKTRLSAPDTKNKGKGISETVIDLYRAHAAEFDQSRGKDMREAPWFDRFLSLMPASSHILDIGCGSGEPIARYCIERGCAVTGIDASEELIALCRSRFPEHCWHVEDMRQLDIGQQFDGLIAWHSFFHLTPDDQRLMFPRFASHAKSGAALMFTSGPTAGEVIGEWQGRPLYHASLSAEEYRQLLHDNGFRVLHHRVEDPQCGGATVWLAQKN